MDHGSGRLGSVLNRKIAVKIMLETTRWDDPMIPNHVYVFNDSMSKIIAYVRAGTEDLFKFRKPIDIDTARRTFVELEGEDTTSPHVITVEGSKGQKYYVSNEGNGWICTCPGFKYHGKCKHQPQ